MKLTSIATLVALFFVSFSYSQINKTVDTVYVKGNQEFTVYKDGSQSIRKVYNSQIHSTTAEKKVFASYQEEITYLRNYIQAVRTKITIVSSDEKKKEEATQSGWFDEMNGYITDSEKRVAELEILISKQ